MGFDLVDLDDGPLPPLARGDLVVLTRCFLRDEDIERLLSSVSAGAVAIVLQPQDRLTRRVGLTREPGVLLPGYVRPVNCTFGATARLQTHVPIPMVSLPQTDAWRLIAEATTRDQPDVAHPAVVSSRVGDGAVALFFYDLPEAVARIRFGNHDLASYRTLQWAWPHIGDLYAHHVDTGLAHLPQADIHCQLLADVIVDLCPAPLARLWYYERAEVRTACVFQSDGDYSEPEEFDRLAAAVERRGGHVTFYLMRDTKLSEDHVRQFRARGHTFAPHVDPLARGGELYFSIPEALAEETECFTRRFGACSPALQCHCAPWTGYMELVPDHIRNGYRLLFAPLSIPADLWSRYMCGSGRPMKFFDRSGVLHDCWHQPVPIFDDETLIDKLSRGSDAAYRDLEERIEASLNVTHTPVPILSHPVSFCRYSAKVIERCLDLLQREGVPIYHADAWCAFHDRRAAVTISQEWNAAGAIRIVLSGLAGRIPVMVPLVPPRDGAPTVRVDGRPAEATVRERLGRSWLLVDVEATSEHETVEIEARGVAGNA